MRDGRTLARARPRGRRSDVQQQALGILGLHAIQKRAVVVSDQVVVRPMMYVALTYDHRVIDGRESVTFLRHIKDLLEHPTRMLLGI